MHLYGQPADLDAAARAREAHGVGVVEDCAQAHGATDRRQAGRARSATLPRSASTRRRTSARSGTRAPSSPSRTTIAAQARLLRNYGERERFEHVLRGLNSRLDPIQAAVLSAKLARLARVSNGGGGSRRSTTRRSPTPRVDAPATVARGRDHAYHLYVVRTARRAIDFRPALAERGIGTAVHYPTPVHRQPAYRELDVPGGFPVAESLCERVVSLPLSASHTDEEIELAATAARGAAV